MKRKAKSKLGRPQMYPDGSVKLRVVVPKHIGDMIARAAAVQLVSSATVARQLILKSIAIGQLK